MNESCSVCSKAFDVQFRYQMEERDGGFAFFCSHECHRKVVSGEATGGATCSACQKRFCVELVSQVVRVRGELRHACSEVCRKQVLAEADGARLGTFATAASMPAPPPPSSSPSLGPTLGATLGASPASQPSPRASSMHAPARLAIFNHKGGTGKTTTSVSIAAGLAARGLKVLLVDTDSQGNVGVSLGIKAERSLYHVLVMGVRASDAAVRVRPNLDLVVSNETLAAAELYLAGRQNRDRVLRERLASAFDDYDVVLLDCSPSLSLMNQNALVFADGILVPVACDFLSLVGVRQVIKTVKNVNALLHHPVQIHGVLPDVLRRARAHLPRRRRRAEGALRRPRACRRSARRRLKEAPAQGKTIFEYAPESNAAEDYPRVVDHPDAAAPRASSRGAKTHGQGRRAVRPIVERRSGVDGAA